MWGERGPASPVPLQKADNTSRINGKKKGKAPCRKEIFPPEAGLPSEYSKEKI
jgi:hypothetical protein